MRHLRTFLAVLACLAAGPVQAAAPDHIWRTIETPHFVLTFHEGLYSLALRAADALERAHATLAPVLRTLPTRPTQVTLEDDSDQANGSATAFVRPEIDLLAEPPDDLSELGDYDDYVLALVSHEYTHVLHLGIAEGVPAQLNRIFGDLFVNNALSPRFITEGLAVYHETLATTGGRVRSAIYDMYLRADVLEGRMLTLSELTNGPDRWPRGGAAYLYGGRFLAYIASRYGSEAFAGYSHSYGEDIIPFGINLSLHDATGADWIALWEEWTRSLEKRYAGQAARVRAAGPVTVPSVRTSFGENTGAPRFEPGTHRVYYVEASPDRRPHLRRLDLDSAKDEVVTQVAAQGPIAPLPQGGVLLARPEVLEAYRTWGELFLVNDSGEQQLSSALRATDVDVSSDGHAAYVVRRDNGRTGLWRVTIGDGAGQAVPLWLPPRGTNLYAPHVSPDGFRIALSVTRPDRGRDIEVLDLSTGARTKVTDDTAIDLDPSWSADGNTVYFASDRTGIFDVYAAPAAGGEATRITNVLTGAFEPSVSSDGKWLAYTTYSSWGFDVAAVPLEKLTPAPAAPFVEDRPAPFKLDPLALRPVHDYRPLDTARPFRWFPYAAADADGTVVGVSTSGVDIVGRHSWTAAAGYGFTSHQPEGALSYTYGGMYPALTLGLASSWQLTAATSGNVDERVSTGSLTLTFPWASLLRSQQLSIGYEASYLAPQDGGLRAGLASQLSAGWLFSSADQPADAISAEDGVALSLTTRAAPAALGSDFTYATVTVGGSGYLRMPWLRHNVLAVDARFGAGEGNLGTRQLFALGGPSLRDPVLDLLYTGTVLQVHALRGYGRNAFAGKKLALGSVEYRFPLLLLDSGPNTVPLYLGRLSGAVFTEAGTAANQIKIDQLHGSAGAELRMELTVGWAIATLLRLGWGYGFDVAHDGGSHFYLGVGAEF